MKFVWRYIWRKMRDIGNEPEPYDRNMGAIPVSKVARGSDIDGDEGLNITVRNAMGGKIVSFRHYDHKTDRNTHRLYVIHDELDFEKELGKLITLESMRG